VTRRGLGALLLNGLLLVLECLLAAPVLADDCPRTAGFAEGLGTAVGTVVVVLVNGVAIAPVLFPPPLSRSLVLCVLRASVVHPPSTSPNPALPGEKSHRRARRPPLP
jgi:hypothetical protein